MKKLAVLTSLLLFGLVLAGAAFAETATRDEAVQKAKAAAAMVKKDKAAGVAEISKKDGEFVWKDSYVFLMDLNGKMLAHPVKPELTQKPTLLGTPDKNKEKPKMLFDEFVQVAKSKGEGWVDYMWPKPGEEQPTAKETYVYRIPGTDLFTAAGVYK